MKAHMRFLIALTVFMMFAATACSSDDDASDAGDAGDTSEMVSQADFDAAVADAEETIGELEAQIAATAPASVLVQTAVADPGSGTSSPSGWDTEVSLENKIELLASYDTSGDPDAFDPVAHPNVFVTSEGHGYIGYISETYSQSGFQVIDAVTKEHVYSRAFDLGYEKHGTPHGLGVSMDGRWIYVPTSDGGNAFIPTTPNGGRVLVVDSRTGTLHQVIGTGFTGPHHIKAFYDYEGNSRVIVETSGGPVYLLDPDDDNRVIKAIGPDVLYGRNYQVDADPTGQYLYIGLTLGTRRNVYDSNGGAVVKYDLETDAVTYINGVGQYPNGFTFSADGKLTYVADMVEGMLYKIDNATNRVLKRSQTATAGPYEICLNYDETQVWAVGKGEFGWILDGRMGMVDTKSMRAGFALDVGGQTMDHCFVNPWDPDELWITSSGTAETIVLDMAARSVKARIPDANGGDTHGGAFVEYNPDFTGFMLNDMSGPRGWFLEDVEAAAAAAAAG